MLRASAGCITMTWSLWPLRQSSHRFMSLDKTSIRMNSGSDCSETPGSGLMEAPALSETGLSVSLIITMVLRTVFQSGRTFSTSGMMNFVTTDFLLSAVSRIICHNVWFWIVTSHSGKCRNVFENFASICSPLISLLIIRPKRFFRFLTHIATASHTDLSKITRCLILVVLHLLCRYSLCLCVHSLPEFCLVLDI